VLGPDRRDRVKARAAIAAYGREIREMVLVEQAHSGPG
jgi:hypothetical protein